jgi:DNA-directed RNA polymerase subunit M/transcription elongation factor TFIIS
MTPPKSGMSASCPCGAALEIDPNETTQEIACPECGMTLEIAVAIDSRTKQVKLGILVKSTSMSQRTAKGKGVEVHTAKCVCGALITVESSHVDEVYTCSACEADYTAVLKKPKSGGSSTLVLRPLVAAPVTKKLPGAKPVTKAPPPKPAARPAPAPPPPKVFAKPPAPPSAPTAAGLAAKEKLLQMSKTDVGAQEFKDGRISCFCRATIELKDSNPREIVKCPECGTGFRIFQATNPRTGDAMAVMIPRG